MTLVRDVMDIDEDLLEEKAAESPYWQTCYEFYDQVKDRPYESLTLKQTDWLEKIGIDLEKE